jgi:hypothetical protein
MTFSKSFPKTYEGSNYPKWIEIFLTEAEENEQEILCRNDNIKLMRECIRDAKELFKENGLKDYQSDVINIAIALFEKRASHAVYYKESKAKEKFDSSTSS